MSKKQHTLKEKLENILDSAVGFGGFFLTIELNDKSINIIYDRIKEYQEWFKLSGASDERIKERITRKYNEILYNLKREFISDELNYSQGIGKRSTIKHQSIEKLDELLRKYTEEKTGIMLIK